MFELFLALFGGMYYAARIHNEKSNSKKVDERNQKLINELNEDMHCWIRKVVDEKAEYEMQNADNKTIQDMQSRIMNEATVTSVTSEMILMGLLAQQGKIPKGIAESGIRSRGVWDYAEKLRWKEQRRFMLWYDKELRKHGITEPLLFVDGINEHSVYFNMDLARPVTESSQMIGGRYFWKPMRKFIY